MHITAITLIVMLNSVKHHETRIIALIMLLVLTVLHNNTFQINLINGMKTITNNRNSNDSIQKNKKT